MKPDPSPIIKEPGRPGVTKPVRRDLEFNGVNPGMGHGEVAGFEASVVLNRTDFGIDIDMPLPSGGAVVGRIAIINARLTLRELIDRVDLRHDRGCR
jgi:hypothetical protein